MKNRLLVKKITALLVFYVIFCACEEEARKFDISKSVDFEFHIDTIQNNMYDTLAVLDFIEHDNLDDYEDYAEQYTINELAFSLEPLPENVATDGRISGSVTVNGSEVMLFDLEGTAIQTITRQFIPLDASLLQNLTQQVDNTGRLALQLSYEGQQEPVSFIFHLHFDTTVAVNLDF